MFPERKNIFALLLVSFLALPSSFAEGKCDYPYDNLILPQAKLPKRQKKDTVYWTNVMNVRMSLNQYAYSNWSAGGDNSIAGAIYFDQAFKYEKEKLSFTTKMDLGLGYMMMSNVEAPFRKTDDKINLNAQGNYSFAKHLAYSLVFDFKSQFADGFKYPDDSTLRSTFFAPAYFTISLGINYKPIKQLECFLSPISGKFTMVLNDYLANQGSYGVIPAKYDSLGVIIEEGKHFRSELGFNFVFKYSQEITKSIIASAKLELHNSYFDVRVDNRWNFDVDFETLFTFHITKHFTTNIYCHAIYDDDIRFPVFEEVNGEQVMIKKVPKLQFYENLGIGLAYRF